MSDGTPESPEIVSVLLSIAGIGPDLPPAPKKSFLADIVSAFVEVQKEMGQEEHTLAKIVREALSGGKLLGLAKVLDPVVDVAAKFNKAEAQRAMDALDLRQRAAETALAVARAQLKASLVALLQRCLDGKVSAKRVGDKVQLMIQAADVLEPRPKPKGRPGQGKAKPAEA